MIKALVAGPLKKTHDLGFSKKTFKKLDLKKKIISGKKPLVPPKPRHISFNTSIPGTGGQLHGCVLSKVGLYSSVHCTIHLLKGTRKTRSCIHGCVLSKVGLYSSFKLLSLYNSRKTRSCLSGLGV